MPGIQVFTRFNVGKETTRGTPVAPTRQMYGEGKGVLEPDFGIDFHEGENAGRRVKIRRATSKSEDVSLKFKTVSGVSYDELVIPFSQLKGAQTGSGAGADKSWSFAPSQTAANNPEAYSIDVGDDVQNWRVQYGMIPRFKLSAALGDLTQLECDWFGQRAVKTTAASPTVNNAIKIPGDIWTIAFAGSFAGLTAASAVSNFLTAWDLEVFTGLVWDHTMDGNPYGGQHVETSISGKLNLKVESTAQAVSQFYDKAVAQTMDWVRLRATGPTLGGSTYICRFDIPVLYEVPKPIASEHDGINEYTITARVADDGTNTITPTLTNSIAALP